MTLFIKLIDGEPSGSPIVEQNFRQLFPSTSFPKYYSAADVEPFGYGLWDYSSQPDLGKYQKAVKVAPVRDASGIWRQSWSVVDMSDAEKAAVDATKSAQVRNQRTMKLFETDWKVVKHYEAGESVPESMKAYRQALRDITDHVNFPYLLDTDWPAEPA